MVVEYDGSGRIVAASGPLVDAEFVVDPMGLGNLIGEYDAASGDLIAAQVFELGLVSRHDSGGGIEGFLFDSLGNVMGSNLANLGLVLGAAAIASPLSAPGVAVMPLVVLGALTVIVCTVVLACRFVGRWMGFALLAAFSGYQAALFA